MLDTDKLAQEAAGRDDLRNQLISDYTPFILSCASKVSGRRITRSDDEWSVALSAFSEAIDSYNMAKGSFLSHARLVITRRLIDQQRARMRVREIAVPPETFAEEEESRPVYRVVSVVDEEPDGSLKDELILANDVLNAYGFSFMDLAGHTPRKSRPRGECADAVGTMRGRPPLVDQMRLKRQLPLARLCELCSARKKTLSLFRWFVIAATEILLRDFPSLRRYFTTFMKEAE